MYSLRKQLVKDRSSKSLISPSKTQQEALHQLLLCLIEPPILACPGHSKGFLLLVNASGKGLGAVLLQYQEGDLRVISYGSRTLTPTEKKYHSSKLEFFGVKWAIRNQFRDYLYCTPQFHIHTDNNPVTYIMSTGKLAATSKRWANEVAEFSFSLHYKPGKQNITTDINTLRTHSVVYRNSSS